MNDTALLKRYSEMGDAEAFAELTKRYAHMVYSTCIRVTENQQDAEDITQECFLELARKANQIRSSLPGWLHKVAKNRSLNAIRKNAIRRQHEQISVRLDVEQSESCWAEIAPIIDEALDKLPDKLQKPVMLRYFQGLSQSEVAEALGVNQSTISRYLDKAVNSLRTEIKKSGILLTAGALAVLLEKNAKASVPSPVMTELGKIAVSGIGVSAGATPQTTDKPIFLSKPIMSIGSAKAILIAGVIAVSTFGGYSAYTNFVLKPAQPSNYIKLPKRAASILQFYLIKNTNAQKNAWRVSKTNEGYIFEYLNSNKDVSEVINSAKQPDMIMNKVVNPKQNYPILTTNDFLANAKASTENSGEIILQVELTERGKQVFSNVTSKNIGKNLCVFANNKLITAPKIGTAISGNRIAITGFKTYAEADTLAKEINGNR